MSFILAGSGSETNIPDPDLGKMFRMRPDPDHKHCKRNKNENNYVVLTCKAGGSGSDHGS